MNHTAIALLKHFDFALCGKILDVEYISEKSMAKGFGTPNEQLGFVLVLMPETNAYAARFSLAGDGEEFIGITNIIEDAQVWKKQGQARKALPKYAEFLIQRIEESGKGKVSLRKVERDSHGKIHEEEVSKIFISIDGIS